MSNRKMKSIFEYLDYRKFLNEYFIHERDNTTFFSFRYVEKKVGVDASNLSKILQGKRHITDAAFDKFVDLIGFNEKEATYFDLLIQFARTRSKEKRAIYFEKLMSFNSIDATKISFDRYEFYSHWYYSAVLALLYYFDASYGEWNKIATELEPQISEEEAKEAVDLLRDLNFIKVEKDGSIHHTDAIITTGEQWKNITLENFQKETIDLAARALSETTPDERHVSTLTVTLSEDSYQRIREITSEYRKAVLKVVSESEDTNKVYQINMQMFPLSRGGFSENS